MITILMIFPASVIQTEDKIIDGTRIRYSDVTLTSRLTAEDYDITKYDRHINTEHAGTFPVIQKFPIAIMFPETLMIQSYNLNICLSQLHL